MRRLLLTLVVIVIGVIGGLGGTAHAQYNVPSQATGDSSRLVIAGDDQEIATAPAAEPSVKLGYELGASLDFLMRDRTPDEKALQFTDVVMFRVHGLLAIGKRAELFAGIDLLPKQPSYTDELV